jgi:hypothetical protein
MLTNAVKFTLVMVFGTQHYFYTCIVSHYTVSVNKPYNYVFMFVIVSSSYVKSHVKFQTCVMAHSASCCVALRILGI